MAKVQLLGKIFTSMIYPSSLVFRKVNEKKPMEKIPDEWFWITFPNKKNYGEFLDILKQSDKNSERLGCGGFEWGNLITLTIENTWTEKHMKEFAKGAKEDKEANQRIFEERTQVRLAELKEKRKRMQQDMEYVCEQITEIEKR
jgi:hypothetical protein